jgi:transcriptional regulator with XRE-family HTH domain
MSPFTKSNKKPALGNVGGKLRDLRKSRNLTQSDLAARIGIQQSDLCRMENGQYRVNLETLVKILMEFQITFGEFFQEEVQGELSQEERSLVRSYRGADPEVQAQIRRFVEFVRSESRLVSDSGPETESGPDLAAGAAVRVRNPQGPGGSKFPGRSESGAVPAPAEPPPPALIRRKPRPAVD